MKKIDIRANSIELTPAIEEYIYKKAESFDKYIEGGDGARLYVEIEKTTAHHRQGEVFRAEFNLSTSKGQFRAEEEASDLYAALDEVKDELLSEIRKEKDKHQTLLKRGHQKVKDFLRRFNN